ncbi:MAG: hypothetical protein VSS75_002515 [Candidatus Parabeggiatoa sp.]
MLASQNIASKRHRLACQDIASHETRWIACQDIASHEARGIASKRHRVETTIRSIRNLIILFAIKRF